MCKEAGKRDRTGEAIGRPAFDSSEGSVSPGMGRDSWLECRGPLACGICCPVTGGSGAVREEG